MNYKELYAKYSKDYDAMKNFAKKYGESIAEEQKLSRDEFKTNFAAKKKQYETALGRKLSDKEAVKELVDEQKYFGTLEQTRALRNAMKKQGYDITWAEARKWGGIDPEDVKNEKVQQFWWDVQQQRKSYLLQHPGATPQEVSKFIAITMFGSPN